MRLAARSALSAKLAHDELDRQPPDEHTRRGELDEAVDPEGKQAHACRLHATPNGGDGLDHHPGDGRVFQPECTPDQLRPPRVERDGGKGWLGRATGIRHPPASESETEGDDTIVHGVTSVAATWHPTWTL